MQYGSPTIVISGVTLLLIAGMGPLYSLIPALSHFGIEFLRNPPLRVQIVRIRGLGSLVTAFITRVLVGFLGNKKQGEIFLAWLLNPKLVKYSNILVLAPPPKGSHRFFNSHALYWSIYVSYHNCLDHTSHLVLIKTYIALFNCTRHGVFLFISVAFNVFEIFGTCLKHIAYCRSHYV